MRHVNRPQKFWNKPDENRPYMIIKYNSKPKADQTHIEILRFVCENPGCLRREIVNHIKPGDWVNTRGYMSTVFSNLLYHDFLDYDKHYRYTLTEKGMQRLIMLYK